MSTDSEDEAFAAFDSNVGSRYPLHDACEFEDAEALRQLIFVRQDESDDSDSSSSDDDSSSSDDNDSHAAAHAAAIGHSPELTRPTSVTVQLDTADKAKAEDTEPVKEDAGGAGTAEGPTDQITPAEAAGVVHRSPEVESAPRADEAAESMEISPSGDKSEVQANSQDAQVGEQQDSAAAIGESKKQKKEKKKAAKVAKEPQYYCPHDLNERDDDENTPIHVAIHACKLEHVSLLLEAGALHYKKCDGSFPVHLAISLGAIHKHAAFAYDCVKLLRKYDADLCSRDDSLHTPLYLACMANLPSVAGFILQDPEGMQTLNLRADRVGGRALHAAAKFDRVIAGCVTDAARHHGPRSPATHHHHGHHHNHHGHQRPNSEAVSHHPATNGEDSAPQGNAPASPAGESASKAVLTRLLLATPGIEIDPPNNYGRTPLHIACFCGNWPVVRLLLQQGANALNLDKRGYTPGRLAQKRGMVIPSDLIPVLSHAGPPSSVQTPSRDLIMDPDSKTLVMSHELCSRHMSCPPITRAGGPSADPPPENIRRLSVLLNEEVGILRSKEFGGVFWESEARRASIADVLKVHEYSYVESISQLCSSLPDHPSAISSVDADTAVSRWSFEAAMRASGSVCEAVDKVMSGDFRNAFCAVRPPGHHAGPRGIVKCPNDPEGSHGFCLLNNVAIGAAYARSMYRNDGIQKIAIIDFDVHHGNGTEEIVKQLIPSIERASIRTPFAVGALQVPKYRPWLDENDVHNVFFSSTHGYGPRDLRFADHVQPNQGGWFYPASGKTVTTDAIASPSSIENPSLTDFLLSQTWTRMGDDSRSNCCKIINVGLDLPRPSDVPGMQRVEFRDSYRKNILPHLLDFDPDIIFISAGFDAHKKDTMNFGYVGMVEDDYEWVTEQLVKVANTCCNGRVVSVLEGGYKIHGGVVSPFARSVASHVRALVDGGSSRELYDKQDEDWESQFERHMVEEKERKRQLKMERGAFNRPVELVSRHHHNLRQPHVLPAAAFSPTAEVTDHQVEGHDDMVALMKEPLDEHHEAHHSNHSAGDAADGEGGENEEDGPTRKRRRNQVDYKELYEKMKMEEGASK